MVGFVLVGGWPAAGQTTLARSLACELKFAYLSKDDVKEALMDALGAPSAVEESRDHVRLTACVNSDSEQTTKLELLRWLDAQRTHQRTQVAEQVRAMPAQARRRSHVPSGWTPRGLIRHLTLDAERVWFRALMAGERVELPEGYDGWTGPDLQSDEELLEQYADECRLATAAVGKLSL